MSTSITERKNLTQPKDWWLAFQKEAKSKNLSLSEWIGLVCKKELPKKVRLKLKERKPAHRPVGT